MGEKERERVWERKRERECVCVCDKIKMAGMNSGCEENRETETLHL